MRNRDKVRYQLFLEPRLADRLEELAARPGVARSDILVEALDAWLTRQGGHDLDERFGVRLDRMSRSLGRAERDIQVLLESLSLFVHYQFCLNAQIPEPDAAARAVGRDRFQKFIDQIGRRMAAGADSDASIAEAAA
ncbi:CopG family transcriptional regulator [Sandaracinobacter neustonicus]|uniref:CopG family transcriptional regulator n=1 Tax=Sandaracinobacter neustonicus TaxID=1715348 RepID=A0A501XGW9_9SPHN|nr:MULTISPECIES: CopG family transcriptional regulator [Alphaproteobacteria]PZU47967.1 MAG: CopG family transcriptional regulator [Sphingomonas sp.]TPE59796.1 CopG family transcriptional regulator [Sandaracinobacter neustonicus]HBI20138.1 CopG family transcriptional regulator [Brevundimonas sp.]